MYLAFTIHSHARDLRTTIDVQVLVVFLPFER